MRQIFLDTETTGLHAQGGDRLVELGCVEMINRRLTGRNLHLYFNPQRDMPEEAFKVHGLSEEFLADKPLFKEQAERILAFIDGAELIIHNARFDLGFLNAELALLGQGPVEGCISGVIDTVELAREMYPGKAASLDALCRRLEVDNTGRTLHGALLDAELLAEVYVRMTRGQDMLLGDAGDEAVGVATLGMGASGGLTDWHPQSLGLKAVLLSADDELAHQALIKDLDKACGGESVWRRAAVTEEVAAVMAQAQAAAAEKIVDNRS